MLGLYFLVGLLACLIYVYNYGYNKDDGEDNFIIVSMILLWPAYIGVYLVCVCWMVVAFLLERISKLK